jgi:hypothetical protein
MDGLRCAPRTAAESSKDYSEALLWSMRHFGGAKMGDQRLNHRLVQVAAVLAEKPGMSLPHQMPDWAALSGAYRFLSNPRVESAWLLEPHVQFTREQLAAHPVVLCVHDDTQLDFTLRTGLAGLGMTGDSMGRGLHMHAALAVLPERSLVGLLDLSFCTIEKAPPDETRRQRQARRTLLDAWPEAVAKIGTVGAGVPPTYLIHMGDRAADMYLFMDAAVSRQHGFLVRSLHDRWIDDDTMHLAEKIRALPVGAIMKIQVPVRRNKGNKILSAAREALLEVRFTPVTVPPSRNDPRTEGRPVISAWAVELQEIDAPAGVKEPIYWRLLTSEPVADLAAALRIVRYYTYRWIIEEFFRCYKEGCRIEASQLDDAEDIKRLGSILAVVAVRLLQLRDLGDPHEPRTRVVWIQGPQSQEVLEEPPVTDVNAARRDDPAALRALVPPLYIRVAARLGRVEESTLTPRKFLLIVAKRGGYLNRKCDPRPGWRALWHGWYDLTQMVRGAQLVLEDDV